MKQTIIDKLRLLFPPLIEICNFDQNIRQFAIIAYSENCFKIQNKAV